MKLYCFASNNLTNIWAGIGSKTWAVHRTSDKDMKSRITKAKKLRVGSLGLLYCNETHSFTTPFIVYSHPDPNKTITEIWPESWVLPFNIYPLGNPNKQVHNNDAKSRWPILVNSNLNSITAALNLTGTTVFVPNNITSADWEHIIQDLATNI